MEGKRGNSAVKWSLSEGGGLAEQQVIVNKSALVAQDTTVGWEPCLMSMRRVENNKPAGNTHSCLIHAPGFSLLSLISPFFLPLPPPLLALPSSFTPTLRLRPYPLSPSLTFAAPNFHVQFPSALSSDVSSFHVFAAPPASELPFPFSPRPPATCLPAHSIPLLPPNGVLLPW